MKQVCLLAALLSATKAFAAEKTAQFYFMDIGHGNVIFVISPSGETMLLDCGPTPAADRIYKFMMEKRIRKIDYLVVIHSRTITWAPGRR